MIKRRLPHLAVSTVQEMGWAGLTNGELLRRAEGQFDVFVTADKRLRSQQNLSGRRLAVVVLPTNQVPVVINLLPQIERTIVGIEPGTIVEIQLSPTSQIGDVMS